MSNIINLWETNGWRAEYRYGLYGHKLIAPNGEVYTRRFIVVKNRYGLVAHFTRLHNFVGVYNGKVFAPLVSDVEAKLLCLYDVELCDDPALRQVSHRPRFQDHP
jgi:hypothetical protein